MRRRLVPLVTLAVLIAAAAVPGSAFAISDLEIGSGGKIIVAGSVGDRKYVGDSYTVASLNPDGSLNRGFAKDGLLGVFGGAATAVQQDGRLVVVGYGKGARVYRYRRSGKLDRGFSKRGKPGFVDITDEPASVSAEDVVVKQSGAIMVAAISYCSGARRGCGYSQSNLDLLRVDSKGKFRGFVRAGEVSLTNALSLAPAGKVLTLGTDEDSDQTVTRIKKRGGLDRGFGGDGGVALGDSLGAMDVEPMADGAPVIAMDLGLIRITSTGSRDSAFGTGGIASCQQVAMPNLGAGLDVVDIQPDDSLLATGPGCGLVRFTPQGVLDQSFGTSGAVATSFNRIYDPTRVAVQPDGRIVIAGSNSSGPGFEVDRFLSDGTPDPSFGVGGKSFVTVPESARSRPGSSRRRSP